MNCFLDQIKSPSSTSLMDGLCFRHGDLALESGKFDCCHGSGLLEVASSDGSQVRKCALNRRLADTRKLYQTYYSYWGKSFPLPPELVKEKTSDQSILAIREFFRSGTQAKLLMTKVANQPSEIWPIALMSSWHLGHRCHIIRFDKCHVGQILPDDEFMVARSDGSKPIFFVEHIQKLFDPLNADKLEQIVSYAYNADCFLVLDFIYQGTSKPSQEEAERPRGFSTRGSMRRYAERLRSKHPIAYLRDDCVSRMEMMVGSPIRC